MASATYKLPGISRVERILGALAAHPEGLSAGELADLTEPPGRVGQIRCSEKLGELRHFSWVHMIGTAAGRGRYPARAVGIWQLAAGADEVLLLKRAGRGDDARARRNTGQDFDAVALRAGIRVRFGKIFPTGRYVSACEPLFIGSGYTRADRRDRMLQRRTRSEQEVPCEHGGA